MINLRKVDEDNVMDIVKLSVNDEQKTFVATNTESISKEALEVIGNEH